MKEETYVLKNIESFEPKHIFECGQCFRWNEEDDSSYTGVIGKNVVNIKKENKDIIIKGIFKDNIKDICTKYFDLDTNYEDIKEKLSKIDNNIKTSIEYGEGIRILDQDIWETLISFIISANNNIPRIKGIIERLCKRYGREIKWKNKSYYTFPTPEELSRASVKDLRLLGLGFRDIRVYETTKMVKENKIDIDKLQNNKDVNRIREELLKFPGVGPKVADCIMLFSMKKYEVFPIDVWVKRVIRELYFDSKQQDINKNISNQKILEFANNKFGNLAGLAQQYLFYWRREK